MTFFLEDLHQADAQRTKVGSSLFAKVIWRCQKGMEPYMAFLEGGLGETILAARRPKGTSGALPDKQYR